MIAHIRVKLLTIPTAAGGRRSAFYSGYRPHFRYRGEENGITITTIPEDQCVEPGDTCDAMITFLRPDLQNSRLQTGSSFMIAEGRNSIAHGMITEILDDTMIDPNPRKETVIFVDVDDTLIRSFGPKQIPIPSAIDYVRRCSTPEMCYIAGVAAALSTRETLPQNSESRNALYASYRNQTWYLMTGLNTCLTIANSFTL